MNRRLLLSFSAAAAAILANPAAAFQALKLIEALGAPSGAKTVFPYKGTDAAGRRILLEKRPERIILANYILNAVIVGGVDCISKIVGMTKDGWIETRKGEYEALTKARPELLDIPSIGGFHDNVLNSEKILSLKPDLILLNRSQYEANSSRLSVLEAAGAKVVVVDFHAMIPSDHIKSTELLGVVFGAEDRAARASTLYINGMKKALKAALGAAKPNKSPVYVELGNMGVEQYGNTYNKTLLWGGILANIGANNIAAEMKTPWAQAGREFVASRRPEYVVIAGSNWPDAAADQLMMGFGVSREAALSRLEAFTKRPLWKSLPAVATRSFYGVDHGGLRTISDFVFTLYLAKMLYPAELAGCSPEDELSAFYSEFLPEVDASGTFMISLKD